ncbi:MAG: hypothetical protein ABEJ47_04710 [Halorhabdus sp.]
MQRRRFLAGLATAGSVVAAGCGAVSGDRTLSEPTVTSDSPGRRALVFTRDGDEIGHVDVDGQIDSGVIDLSTEIWHREGTLVNAIELRLWTPGTDATPAEVAVVSPIEGDSSPPPEVTLSTPDRKPGTVVAITDLDDLADETISTIDLNVDPPDAAGALAVHATVELTGAGLLGANYTLDGELELAYPELDGQGESAER